MNSAIVVLCFIGCALAVAPSDPALSQVLRSESDQSPNGSFQYVFETDNGISAQAKGEYKEISKDTGAVVVTGSNSYTNPEGQVISEQYTADENGYHVVGDHLPTPPAPQPIPDYILRSLEYIATHPYTEKKTV